MAATAFPLFSRLSTEIRIEIWKQALPGPRIIYIERLLRGALHPDWAWPQSYNHEDAPFPSYFTSASPNNSIISLLEACQESSLVVRKHYSLILPESSVWFSFSKDFLYLGRRWHYALSYAPRHFTPSFPGDFAAGRYGYPEISEDIAGQIRNLVIFSTEDEEWLARDLLSVFTGVELLVLADSFHDQNESGEDLVWLLGKLGDELQDYQQSESAEPDWLATREMILWRDWSQYRKSIDVNEQKLTKAWNKHRGRQGAEIPKLVKKSVTTAKSKRGILDICGSEDKFQKLASLDWAFVKGDKAYNGVLSLSQQIAFLKLAVGQIASEIWCTLSRAMVVGEFVWDVLVLAAKIDSLILERERLELIISEAEDVQETFAEWAISLNDLRHTLKIREDD